jgi:predicted nucleic acid-binding protein
MVVKAQPVNHLVHRLTPCRKVLGELAFGAEKSAYGQRNRARLAELAQRLPLVGIDAETTRHYAQVRALLERQGTPIGANDTWIAAQGAGHRGHAGHGQRARVFPVARAAAGELAAERVKLTGAG